MSTEKPSAPIRENDSATRHLPVEPLRRAIQSAPKPQLSNGDAFRPAAVFLLIFSNPEPSILAVLKSDRTGYPWRNQVAFPGGIREPGDKKPVDTAYRELDEELGLRKNQIDYLGMLGQFQTLADTAIRAAAGVWTGVGSITPDPYEISRVLRVPISRLLNTHESSGLAGHVPGFDRLRYPVDDLEIWGVTARIVHQFLEVTGDIWKEY